jgi:hypothetical protein
MSISPLGTISSHSCYVRSSASCATGRDCGGDRGFHFSLLGILATLEKSTSVNYTDVFIARYKE